MLYSARQTQLLLDTFSLALSKLYNFNISILVMQSKRIETIAHFRMNKNFNVALITLKVNDKVSDKQISCFKKQALACIRKHLK